MITCAGLMNAFESARNNDGAGELCSGRHDGL
jgi:hypothetical protein